ncbi:MAG: hypothetical protein KJO33_12415 [Gammaproteobacteria bacterium]|nr:hypothetical protein [Gammaproteobacteria bacterium]
MSDLRIIRGASPSRHGGIHWYEWKPKDEARIGPEAPDLLLLHPLPRDGAYFNTIAPLLAAGRTVIAAEYPGYGKSDPLHEAPTIRKYAEAMIDTLRARDTHGRADLLGFHEGCLVATEMALNWSDEVHRLIQVDVPYFSEPVRNEMLENDWVKGGFVAAFTYPCENRYPALRHESLVLATDSDLLEPSRAAAAAIRDSRLLEFPEVHEPALENGAVPLSAAALEFLDG